MIKGKKRVKIQLECTGFRTNTVAGFTRPDEPATGIRSAAGIGLVTFSIVTENREVRQSKQAYVSNKGEVRKYLNLFRILLFILFRYCCRNLRAVQRMLRVRGGAVG
jgi:hypothetical protein